MAALFLADQVQYDPNAKVRRLVQAIMLHRFNAFLRALNALRIVWDVFARRRESNQTAGGGEHGDDREEGEYRCPRRDERTV
jgi:hypothetical protein